MQKLFPITWFWHREKKNHGNPVNFHEPFKMLENQHMCFVLYRFLDLDFFMKFSGKDSQDIPKFLPPIYAISSVCLLFPLRALG